MQYLYLRYINFTDCLLVKAIQENSGFYLILNNDYKSALDILKGKYSLNMQAKHGGQHINWYNFDKTQRMLIAGLNNIYKSGYHQSLVLIMRNSLFDTTTTPTSLYVEP